MSDQCAIVAAIFPTLVNWTANACCGSGGIYCSLGTSGVVTTLDLRNRSLTGPLSSRIGELTSLVSILLSYNSLSGTIPAELSNIDSLNYLYLDWNNFSGKLPPELGRLPNLKQLTIRNNSLTGPIPTEYGGLQNLQYLTFENNFLTGGIPPGLGKLTHLDNLWLTNNSLTGEIPAEFGVTNSIQYMVVGYNFLTGVPPAIPNTYFGSYVYHHNCLTYASNQRSASECSSFVTSTGASSPTSTSPTQPANDAQQSSSTSSTPIIAGSVAAAIVLVGAVVLAVAFARRRKAARGDSNAKTVLSGELAPFDPPAVAAAAAAESQPQDAAVGGAAAGEGWQPAAPAGYYGRGDEQRGASIFDGALAIASTRNDYKQALPVKVKESYLSKNPPPPHASAGGGGVGSMLPEDEAKELDRLFLRDVGPVRRWTARNVLDWAIARKLSVAAVRLLAAQNFDGPSIIALQFELAKAGAAAPSSGHTGRDALEAAFGAMDFETRRQMVSALLGLAASEEAMAVATTEAGSLQRGMVAPPAYYD